MPRTRKTRARTLTTHSKDFKLTVDGKKATLTLILRLRPYTGYKACRRLEVDLDLDVQGEATEEVGYLIGWIVDKTLQSADERELWLTELIDQNDYGAGDGTSELRMVTRKLFRKYGEPRAAVQYHTRALTREKMVFVNTLVLDEVYRGTGIAQEVMTTFHALIREMIDPQAAADKVLASIMLSPAKSSSAAWENGKSDIEAKQGLIESFQKERYEVWIGGPVKKQGSVTVIGRTI